MSALHPYSLSTYDDGPVQATGKAAISMVYKEHMDGRTGEVLISGVEDLGEVSSTSTSWHPHYAISNPTDMGETRM
jgi:hypothetical protein